MVGGARGCRTLHDDLARIICAPARTPMVGRGGGCRDRTRAGALHTRPPFSGRLPSHSANPPVTATVSPQLGGSCGGRADRTRAGIGVPDHGLAVRCLATRPALLVLCVLLPVEDSKLACQIQSLESCQPDQRAPVGRAPGPGLEPGSTEPKSVVLPDTPTGIVHPLSWHIVGAWPIRVSIPVLRGESAVT